MKLTNILLVILFYVPTLFAQKYKSDIEKTFSSLKWVSPENDYQKFGYDPKFFKLKMKKLSSNDPMNEILQVDDITFIGTYKTLKVYFSNGPSEDPVFCIVNSQNREIWSYGTEYMCINSNGIIYVSASTNHMFNTHRKFKIEGETIKEVKQPYVYVGIKGKLLKPIKLYSKKDRQGHLIATLPKGYTVEVLLAEDDVSDDMEPMNYLVRTSFGLVGWLKLGNNDTYMEPVIRGLRFMGD